MLARCLTLCVLLTAAPGFADPLATVNRYRAAAGVPRVTLDDAQSAGCVKHAIYLAKNYGSDAIAGLAAHQERKDLPGASAEGADCGKNADLFVGVADLDRAVDGFMAGIYHRRPVLDPGLAKIGIGTAKLPDGNYVLAIRLSASDVPADKWPVAYPAERAVDIPLEYGNEIPNPVPGGGPAGYPVTLEFPPFDKVTHVTAKLVDGHGHTLPIQLSDLSDPDHPATSFPQLGVVSVIAKQRLQPATMYTATISATWQGKPRTWTWSFTTVALRALDASDRPALTAALGVASRVRGTVSYAGTISGAAFLQLGKGEPMVSVIVPTPVWRELAHGAAPASFQGKTVEVESAPQLVDGKYLNLPIATAQQLRVVK